MVSGLPAHVAYHPSSPAALGMDFLFSCGRSATLPPYLRRTPDRLHAQPGGLGYPRHRRHQPRGALDHLLQADRAGACVGRRPVRPLAATGAKGVPERTGEPGHRRYAGAALREDGAGYQHQARPQPQSQSAHLSEQPVLGHAGTGRARQAGFCADDTDPLLAGRGIRPARQALGGEAADRLGQGTRQGGTPADRRVVHAQEPDSALARTEGAHHRAGAAGYRFVSAAGTGTETPWAETQVRAADRCGHAGCAARAGDGTDAVRQDADGQAAPGHRGGAIPEGGAGAGGVVPDAPGRQHLVAPAPDPGDRDGTDRESRGGNLRRALGYRAFVSQPETVVGCDKPVAAIEGGAGTVDADSLHGVCPDAIACPEVVGILPVDGDRAVAQGGDDHGGTFRAVDAYPIYRTSRARCLQPEVGEFRDAFHGSGSAFAVLRCAASRLSVSDRCVLCLSCIATMENSGRQAAACV